MKIGWVGLGNIGTNMVMRALAAGHQVSVFARGSGLEEVQAAGAISSADYGEVASGCDVLGLCVFTDDQLRSVLFDGGALAAMRPGSTVAMHTTGSPDLAREIGSRAPSGVRVLDATFSGGPADVLAGALTLMIGGDAGAVLHARPLLECYADKIFHVGPLGQGQSLKLLNNLLFATNLKNAAELVRVAEKLGFDRRDVANVIQVCSGGSYAMRSFQHGMSVEDTLARSRRYVEKDVATVASNAEKVGVDMTAFAETVAYFCPSA